MKNQIGCLKDENKRDECHERDSAGKWKKYAKNENELIYSSIDCTIQNICMYYAVANCIKKQLN